MKKILLLLLFLLSIANLKAQTFVQIGTSTGNPLNLNSANTDGGPIHGRNVADAYSTYFYVLDSTTLATLPAGARITRIDFNKGSTNGTVFPHLNRFEIWLKNSTATQAPSVPDSLSNLITGATKVYRNTQQAIVGPAGYVSFILNEPFLYSGGGLEMAFDWEKSFPSHFDAAIQWSLNTANNSVIGYNGPLPQSNLVNARTVRPTMRIHYELPAACVTPVAGNIESSNINFCPNSIAHLRLSGNFVLRANQQFRWQESTNNLVWNDVSSGDVSSLFINVPTSGPIYYRCIVSCGSAADTTPVFTMNPAPTMLGSYTVDASQPASTTNFTSLQAAIDRINCQNLAGPVTLLLANGVYSGNFFINTPVSSGFAPITLESISQIPDSVVLVPADNGQVLSVSNSSNITLKNISFRRNALPATAIDLVSLGKGANNANVINCKFTGLAGSNSANNRLLNVNSAADVFITQSQFRDGYYGIHNANTVGTDTQLNLRVSNNQFNDIHASSIFLVANARGTIIEANTFRNATTNLLAASTVITLTNHSRFSITANTATGNIGQSGFAISNFTGDSTAGNYIVNNALALNFSNATPRAFFLTGSTSGGTDWLELYHNSVQMQVNTSSTTRNGVVHVVHTTLQSATISRIIHRNNVYSVIPVNTAQTTPANFSAYYFPDPTTLATLQATNNAFNIGTFTTFGYVNSPATSYTTLANWQTATSQENNSLLANPLFTAVEDLRPQPNSPLNNAGIGLMGVTTDALGQLRNASTPTIGAYEIVLAGNDAALLRLQAVNQVQQVGNRVPVRVWLRNLGQNALTTAQLNYQLDNNSVVSQTFSGNLAFLDSALFAFNDSLTIPATGALILKVWVASPNGSSDVNPQNDTLLFQFCTPLAAGSYTVGSSSSDFSSMQQLLDRLYCAGISGTVRILTQFPGKISNQRFELGAVPGASATNRLIFDGQNDTISLTPNSNIKHIMLLNGAKFTTIERFVLRGLDAEFGIGIILQNEANNNIIRNNRIDLGAVTIIPTLNSQNASSGIVFTGSLANNTTATPAANNLIDSNVIISGHTGIRLNGLINSPETAGNRFIGNIIRDFSSNGIYVLNSNNTEIAGNEIHRLNRVTTTTFNGVNVEGVNNQLQVHRNAIHNSHTSASSRATPATGIRLSGVNAVDSVSGSLVFNNLIYELNSSAVTIGIQGVNVTFADISNNTIDMASTLSSTGTSRGISLENTVSSVRLLNNNIFQTRNTTAAKHAIAIINTAATVQSNRNNLYVTAGASGSGVGLFGATTALNLADWRAQGFDANGVSADPAFVNLANRNYVPQNNLLNGIAAPLTYVTVDFTGQARNLSQPDVGAFEFTPVGCPGPSQITIDSIQINSARINWVSSASTWELEYGPVGFTPGSGTRISNITSKPYLLTGLSSGICYAVYVRDSCVGQFSPWAGPQNFCTLRNHDLTILSITSPANLSCPDSNITFRAVVKNEGLNSATNFSIGLALTGGVNLNLTGPIQTTINAGATDTVTFATNVSTFPGGLTQAVAVVNYSLDQNAANDTLRQSIQIRQVTQPIIQSSGTTVCTGASVQLWNSPTSGAQNIGWFSANGTLLATADTLTLTPNQSTTVFARALGVINGVLGPQDISIGNSGGFSGITVGNNRLNLQVNKPIVIRGMRIYPQQSGVVRLITRDANDAIVRSDSILVNQGVAYSPIDVQVNIPLQPGTYSFAPTNNQSAGGMWRNSDGAVYPYNFGSYASITGTNSTNAGNYFYFYNLQVEYGSCPSTAVAQAIVVNPRPTAAFNVDSSSMPNFSFNANGSQNASTYTWNFGNGQTASGPTASVTYTQNGTYTVRLIVTNSCGNDTLTRTLRVFGLSVREEINPFDLKMYPNPTSGEVNLSFNTQGPEVVRILVQDALGRTVYNEQLPASGGEQQHSLQLNTLQAGMYQLRIQQGNKTQMQKLVIQR